MGYNGEILPDLRNYNMFREFWKKQPIIQKAISAYEQLPTWVKTGSEIITSLLPESAIAAAPAAKLPKGVLRILPDGTKIMDSKYRGASAKTRKLFNSRDRYLERAPEIKVEKQRIINNMRRDGVSDIDENRIFKELASGKRVLYDKYLE